MISWEDVCSDYRNYTKQGEKKMAHDYQVGQLVKVVGNHNSHRFEIGEVVRIIEDCERFFKAEHLDKRNYWCVLKDDTVPYTGEETKFDEKENRVDTIINAKKLLELDACEDGFKWFVDEYGKRDVSVSVLDRDLKEHDKTSYRQWLHEKFPELKKKERTFKVGDKFKWDLDGSIYFLARINKFDHVTLVHAEGRQVWSGTKIVAVYDDNKITEDELKKINPIFFDSLHPL